MTRRPHHIAFILLPEFPLYALVPAIEALRLANQNAAERLYDWSFASAAGGPVRAGNGMAVEPTRPLDADFMPPFAIVCAGNDPTRHLDRRLLNWLRRRAAFGARLGALDTGAFALAAAGTLAGHRVTLHWEAAPVFRDLYPDIEVADVLWLRDRERWTCAGGVAALDMMLALVEADHGPQLAQIVADGFVYGRMRPSDTPQRGFAQTTPGSAAGGGDGALWRRATAMMAANLDFPLGVDEIAEALSITRRRLERLFRRRVGRPPAAHYLDIRLEAAREQLFYGELPIARIAEATGFLSTAHFSRAFRRRYGQTPSMCRAASTAAERQRFRPGGTLLRSDPEPAPSAQ